MQYSMPHPKVAYKHLTLVHAWTSSIHTLFFCMLLQLMMSYSCYLMLICHMVLQPYSPANPITKAHLDMNTMLAMVRAKNVDQRRWMFLASVRITSSYKHMKRQMYRYVKYQIYRYAVRKSWILTTPDLVMESKYPKKQIMSKPWTLINDANAHFDTDLLWEICTRNMS